MLKTPEETIHILNREAIEYGRARYACMTNANKSLTIDVTLSRTGLGGAGFRYVIDGYQVTAQQACDAITAAREGARWKVWA
jgi:hypothetical protein